MVETARGRRGPLSRWIPFRTGSLVVLGCLLVALLAGSARAADPTFAATTIGTGSRAISVVAANLNGDAFPDLAVANQVDGTVSILLGSSGGFGAPLPPITVGVEPVGVSAGNLNGDGFTDLAVANEFDGTVSILFGNGSGGFPTSSTVAVGSAPQQIVVGTFDSGTTSDLAVVNQDSSNISILLQNPIGIFTNSGCSCVVGSTPKSITAGLFDAGSTIDLATANEGADNVSILLGNGSGGFAPAGSPIAVGSLPSAIGTADLNADTKADLFVANAPVTPPGSVSILLGNGSGGFTQPTGPFTVGTSPEGVASADFNLDGKVDVAAANAGTTNPGLISILLGDGLGGFTAATGTYATGNGPTGLIAAHLNGDTKPDLVSANYFGNSITVLLNTSPTPPTAVALRRFIARVTPTGVELRWRTAQETGLIGFHVYRSGVKLNRTLIAARGAGGAGTTYRLLDRRARVGARSTYRLQAVRADGTRVWLGRTSTKR